MFFINEEERVQRICFYTLDFLDFAELFYTHTNILDSNAIIEITSKNPHLLENDLFHLGFYTIAKQQRISSNNAAFCFSKDSPAFSFMPMSDQELESCIATERDSKQIYTKLREVFDSTTGHLQNIDELKISIHNKQFFILKDSHNNITSLLQAIINPKSFYINQIFNFSKPQHIHGILKGALAQYTQNGGKYLYAWVDETNHASQRFHEKYGLKHDGLWNIVYKFNKIHRPNDTTSPIFYL